MAWPRLLPRRASAIVAAAAIGCLSLALSQPASFADSGNVITVTWPGNQDALIGSSVSLQIEASDSDPSQTLTYAATGLPSGLSIEAGTGLITGTLMTGGIYWGSKITVTDKTGAIGGTYVTWDVHGVITISRPADQAGTVGDAAGLWLRVSDSAPGVTPEFVTAAGLPPGLNIGSYGTCSGSQDQVCGFLTGSGTYHVTVTATDKLNASASVSFTWKVAPAAGNGPTGPVRLGLGGKCLDDLRNSDANGAKVVIWKCDGRQAENWTIAQDGTVRIHGKCLDVPALSNNAGMRLWSCNGTPGENWLISVFAELQNTNQTTYMWCVQDPGRSTRDGTQVRIGTCGGQDDTSQAWVTPAGPINSGVPGKCMDDAGNSAENGAKVVIWTCNGSRAQQWTVRPDGTVRIHGKCLTVTGGSTASRNNVELWTCDGAASQQWQPQIVGLTPGSRGQQMIASVLTYQARGLMLADPGNSQANGTQLVVKRPDYGPGSYWAIR
jgi:hypothetical protein